MFNDKHDCHDILQDMVAFNAILTITLRLKRGDFIRTACELSKRKRSNTTIFANFIQPSPLLTCTTRFQLISNCAV